MLEGCKPSVTYSRVTMGPLPYGMEKWDQPWGPLALTSRDLCEPLVTSSLTSQTEMRETGKPGDRRRPGPDPCRGFLALHPS